MSPGPATAPLCLWAADFTVTNLSVSFTLVLLLCGAVALRLYLCHPRKLPAVLVSLREAAARPQPHGPGKPGAQSQPVLPSARRYQEAPPGTLGGGRTDRSAESRASWRPGDRHPEQSHPARSVVPV